MIYLDNNATTVPDARVVEDIFPLLSLPLNPSSIHSAGRVAKGHLDKATRSIAKDLGVAPGEIVFTSGATEALNLVLQGFTKKGHIISSTLEHIAVLASLQKLEKQGWTVTYLSPKQQRGAISPEQVREALRENTILIVLMGANNETGIKTDIEAIGQIAEHVGCYFVSDLVALFGKEPFVIPKGLSAFCLSAHKIHGLPGCGVAAIKKSYPFSPILVGGPQQNGRRGGTENMAAICAMAKAIEIAQKEVSVISLKIQALRDRFEKNLSENLVHILIHGKDQERVCNVSSIAFLGVSGETLLMALDGSGIAASSGSACSSGTLEASRVLLAMGLSRDVVLSTIRFSLSKFTTPEEIDQACLLIIDLVTQLRCYER